MKAVVWACGSVLALATARDELTTQHWHLRDVLGLLPLSLPVWFPICLAALLVVVVEASFQIARKHKQHADTDRKTLDITLAEASDAIDALKHDLEVERESFVNCPQLVVEYEDAPIHTGLFVRNTNPDNDAFNVEFTPVDGIDLRLVGDKIARVQAGHVAPLVLQSEKTSTRAGIAALPRVSDEAAFFTEVAGTSPFATVSLILTYTDASGRKRFQSKSTALWYTFPSRGFHGVHFLGISRLEDH